MRKRQNKQKVAGIGPKFKKWNQLINNKRGSPKDSCLASQQKDLAGFDSCWWRV